MGIWIEIQSPMATAVLEIGPLNQKERPYALLSRKFSVTSLCQIIG